MSSDSAADSDMATKKSARVIWFTHVRQLIILINRVLQYI